MQFPRCTYVPSVSSCPECFRSVSRKCSPLSEGIGNTSDVR